MKSQMQKAHFLFNICLKILKAGLVQTSKVINVIRVYINNLDFNIAKEEAMRWKTS